MNLSWEGSVANVNKLLFHEKVQNENVTSGTLTGISFYAKEAMGC